MGGDPANRGRHISERDARVVKSVRRRLDRPKWVARVFLVVAVVCFGLLPAQIYPCLQPPRWIADFLVGSSRPEAHFSAMMDAVAGWLVGLFLFMPVLGLVVFVHLGSRAHAQKLLLGLHDALAAESALPEDLQRAAKDETGPTDSGKHRKLRAFFKLLSRRVDNEAEFVQRTRRDLRWTWRTLGIQIVFLVSLFCVFAASFGRHVPDLLEGARLPGFLFGLSVGILTGVVLILGFCALGRVVDPLLRRREDRLILRLYDAYAASR